MYTAVFPKKFSFSLWALLGPKWPKMAQKNGSNDFLFLFFRSELIQIWHRCSLCKIHIWHFNANFQFFGSRMAQKWLRIAHLLLLRHHSILAQMMFTSYKECTNNVWCSLSIFWLHIGSKMATRWLWLFFCSFGQIFKFDIQMILTI